MEHAFDVALTLHADHELNASTFAARVTRRLSPIFTHRLLPESGRSKVHYMAAPMRM